MDIIKITGAAVVLMSSFMLGMYFVVVNKIGRASCRERV